MLPTSKHRYAITTWYFNAQVPPPPPTPPFSCSSPVECHRALTRRHLQERAEALAASGDDAERERILKEIQKFGGAEKVEAGARDCSFAEPLAGGA